MSDPVRVGHFEWVRAWGSMDSGMPEHIRATAGILFTYLSAVGEAWPKQVTIAERRGLNEDVVGRHMRWMADNGWLTYRRRVGRSSVSYVTIPAHLAASAKVTPASGTNPTPTTAKPDAHGGSIPTPTTAKPDAHVGTEVPPKGLTRPDGESSPQPPVGAVAPRGPVGKEKSAPGGGTPYGERGWNIDPDAVDVPPGYVWMPDAVRVDGTTGLWKRGPRTVGDEAIVRYRESGRETRPDALDVPQDLFEWRGIAWKPIVRKGDPGWHRNPNARDTDGYAWDRNRRQWRWDAEADDDMFEEENEDDLVVTSLVDDLEPLRKRLLKLDVRTDAERKQDARTRKVAALVADMKAKQKQVSAFDDQNDFAAEAAWEAAGEMYGA